MRPSEMTPLEWERWNRENQILINMERGQVHSIPAYSQPQQSSATRMPPNPSGQPYFTPGGFSEAKDGVIAGIFAPVMYACFKAAARYAVEVRGRTQDDAVHTKAMLHAMDMVMRWKAWAFTILYWVVSGVCIYFWRGAEAMQGDPATGYTTGKDVSFQTMLLVLHVALLLPAILIPYCQHVEASFFKQRTLYNVLRPIHVVLGRIPWFVLQTTVLLPLCFIIQYRW